MAGTNVERDNGHLIVRADLPCTVELTIPLAEQATKEKVTITPTAA